ncbi:carbohydrate-binding module family 20 domain-containing protein [Actinoplanes teichomyceticus]|uniref:Alpha-amylase n=1 Tax=Actinoplanes teichomyceticus TaxID=1867 RepID=A0A561WAK9_ACTTI|nr:carbohydrate-binding module family 20 domain-containing protein [Actinoplanes teichomyceticus]TWG20897.1 alpha-amylase [Actinoplanes teichomyceticus]GIF16483.1 alpha-amylase [Actinoplanes teichomyceticus]
MRKRTRELILGSVSSLALAAAGLVGVSLATTANAAVALNNSDVTANLWEWNFRSIAAACTNHLGPAGYGAVQVAPPQESVTLASTSDGAHPWWEVYQPVSYQISGRLGTQAEFTSMITACHNAGVRVYVDAVINHMAGSNNTVTTGYGGSTFSPSGYSYPAVPYAYGDFHHPNDGYCADSDGVIDDYNNAAEVQNCELVALSDLKSQDSSVRTKIAGYLNKLIDWGVDGFRVDAAKHMAAADLSAIKAQLHNTTAEGRSPYFAQEVIPGGSGETAPSAYTGIGDVLGFSYAYGLKTQFANGTLSNLSGIPSWGQDASSDLTAAMVTNHDLERNGSTLRYQDGATYTLANYFLLAHPFGQPFLYDGFTFSTSATGASPPASSSGHVTDTSCTNGAWQCLTQSTGVKGMVAWRNTTRSATTVTNWTNTAGNVIGFSRGSLGWFGVNRSGSASTATYPTGLPDGTYCDRITGGATTGGCAGTSIAVSGGRASVTIPANGAVAIDVNAKTGAGTGSPSASATSSPTPSTSPTDSTGTVRATFNVYATTTTGTRVYVVGSNAALGNWDTAKAVPLSAGGYPIWSSTVTVPANGSFEYKYLKKDAAGNVTWESNANRAVTTGGSAVTATDSFNVSNAAATAVTFTATATTSTGTNVYVVGSIPALGGWNTADAIPLPATAYPTWSRSVIVPKSTSFTYKYLKKDASGNVTWESGSNRSYTTGTAGSYTVNDTWR